MAYAHCPHCDCSLDKPTAKEIVAGERDCPRCDKRLVITTDSINDVILELDERLTLLEIAIAAITKAIGQKLSQPAGPPREKTDDEDLI